MVHQDDANSTSSHWATEYSIQQKIARQTRHWKRLLRPSVIVASLAVAGRVLLGPLALLLLFTATNYYSDGSVLIKATESFFAFTERDMTMSGGCSGCIGPCKITLLKYTLFNGSAFVSSPVFNAFVALGPVESLYDFTSLSPEALALGESLDRNGAVCQSGINEWGATHNVATGTAQQILDIILTLGLSVAPQMVALLTKGEDFLRAVPDSLTLFPYSFSSSLPLVSRRVPAGVKKYQPSLNLFFAHTSVVVVCASTGGVCIHNYFNSLWEWLNYVSEDQPARAGMVVNSFRIRYGDTVPIDILPVLVVAQILLMGIVSFYQVMSHKRSVLLTQIWAYRCQNGRMQVVYLAQIVFYSDLYMIGLVTGTLTGESIANLTCCTFALSYSFINLLKARSGEQQLDRHFRLTWETMQLVTTIGVGSILLSVPFESIITKNAEILRKTSARGAKYCGLNDSCILFTVDIATVIAVLALCLGAAALIIAFVVTKVTTKASSVVRSTDQVFEEVQNFKDDDSLQNTRYLAASEKKQATTCADLTTFEKHCIGVPFRRLFRDCDDISYVMYNGKRCTTVEALLLTGHLYYGEHVYEASSAILLLLARLVPT
ncbi:hypothetical protein PF004_g27191 [Phytophthora fragariae]|uniref:Uncharacterized protein n=1 Tax=Phytophthora fragariae TaxID=53985 RepID=A0A6G0MM25_9STRA|nr:hypothetical protein PF004_g27191 [Phytophthora fragariae]